ncbi:MAG: peptide ABC transporter substrate-binding protein [Anaerolineales bacterium]
MKPKSRFAYSLLMTAVLLLACQAAGQVTPTAAPDTLIETAAATPTAVLPPNTIADPELGFTITYPRGWTTQPGENANNLAVFLSPDQTVQASLYSFPLTSDTTVEEEAHLIEAEVMADFETVTILRDEALVLNDGHPAWEILVSAETANGTLKVSFLVAFFGAREFLLLTFGPSQAFDYYAGDILALQTSLRLELPSLYNIPRDQALVLAGSESTNPREYDPATTHSAGDKLVFSGLVSFDPNLNLVPELAESWEVSPDGTVYTFHLRQNARFHDGRPVTAHDVVYSWERAADPATQSDTVLTYLGDIVGVEAMVNGQADHIAGLRVIDDHTLEVTIQAPLPYFLMKLTYPTAFVVDEANVTSGPEWYRTPNGTGPYRLIRWDSFEVMIYERNLDFYLGPPAIPYVVVQLYAGVGIRLYEAGEIDIAGVSPYDVARVTDPNERLSAEVHSNVSLCTTYVLFDVAQPPFDDLRVRQAFTLAFNRQQYIDVVYSGVGLPARGLYPPALPGHDVHLAGPPYDPAAARRLLAESRYGGPAGLPPIVFTTAGYGSDSSPAIAAMVQMWEQNLGVSIIVENIEPNMYYDLIYDGRHGQLISSGWCADYPDPENFADVLFRTGAPQNLGHYSNPALDALLDEARIERDVDRRMQLYQQAERIIVADAPALFIMHDIDYVLVKPYVEGYVLTPINIPLERYLSLGGR